MSTDDAEILRQAAALMRERAEATSGPHDWHYLPIKHDDGEMAGLVRGSLGQHRWTVAETDHPEDARHIAAWNPEVALAVARLLEREARATEVFRITEPRALDVARAYLRIESEQHARG